MRAIAFLVSIFLASGLASAADEAGQFAVKGVGGVSCEVFTDQRSANLPAYARFVGWLEGYATASNQLLPETFDVTPWQTTDFIASIIDNHCSKHPKDQFMAVVLTVYREMHEERLKAQSKQVEIKEQDQRIVLYEQTLRSVQDELAAQGHYRNQSDGRFGVGTRQALMAFQRKSALPQTGLPDQLTLWNLLKPLPTSE